MPSHIHSQLYYLFMFILLCNLVAGKGLVNLQKLYATHQNVCTCPDNTECVPHLHFFFHYVYFVELISLHLVAGKGLVNLQKLYATHRTPHAGRSVFINLNIHAQQLSLLS